MLTAEEQHCLDIAQSLRQRALKRQVYSVSSIVWPKPLRGLAWSDIRWRRVLQGGCLVLIWPLVFLAGLMYYLWCLICFPFRYCQTFMLPKGLKSPGEKTLLGMDNAFKPVLRLSDRDYIECVDQWVVILFGGAVAQEKSLSVYLARIAAERSAILGVDGTVNSRDSGFRSELRIAKQRLSLDLGHYLRIAKSRAPQAASVESLAS